MTSDLFYTYTRNIAIKMNVNCIVIWTRNTFCRTRSLSNATSSFLITSRSSSSKSAAVYKISWKSDDSWDMAIYRFSKWRPSAILELFYHHTRPPTKSLLLAAAVCQISCQSGTQIWRYSYLNFLHIWFEINQSINQKRIRVTKVTNVTARPLLQC